jgi:hypothetical protein
VPLCAPHFFHIKCDLSSVLKPADSGTSCSFQIGARVLFGIICSLYVKDNDRNTILPDNYMLSLPAGLLY